MDRKQYKELLENPNRMPSILWTLSLLPRNFFFTPKGEIRTLASGVLSAWFCISLSTPTLVCAVSAQKWIISLFRSVISSIQAIRLRFWLPKAKSAARMDRLCYHRRTKAKLRSHFKRKKNADWYERSEENWRSTCRNQSKSWKQKWWFA